MNPILSAVLRRFWTILVLLVIADLVIVLWILNGTLRFNRDNRQLAHAIQNLRTPSPTIEKAALLQKENERLKSDLKMIPGLNLEETRSGKRNRSSATPEHRSFEHAIEPHPTSN